MSIVRENLLKDKGYAPYCGDVNCDVMPRTFFNGDQFECPLCGWISSFEPEFIKTYKDVWSNKTAPQPLTEPNTN